MRVFLLIVFAGLGCAALGSGVGWLIGGLSPEFIALIAAQSYPVVESERLGAVLGLLSGLLLGVAAMGFGLLLEAFRAWALRGSASREVPSGQTLPPSNRDEDSSSSFHVRNA